MVLNARKGQGESAVSLRHSMKVDTSHKVPVHHRRNIEVTFLSPLLVFEILAACMWVVGLAGVCLWQGAGVAARAARAACRPRGCRLLQATVAAGRPRAPCAQHAPRS